MASTKVGQSGRAGEVGTERAEGAHVGLTGVGCNNNNGNCNWLGNNGGTDNIDRLVAAALSAVPELTSSNSGK